MYTYRYPRPSVTADIAILSLDLQQVLLIRRGNDPFKGMWALPGGDLMNYVSALIKETSRAP